MNHLLKILSFGFLILSLTACQARPELPEQTPPAPQPDQKKEKQSNPPDVKGIITKITEKGENLEVMIEEDPNQEMSGSKGNFTVTQNTNIRYANLETFVAVTVKDLKLKQKVSAWCDGVHIQIYPLQCKAKEIVIGD